MDNNKEIIDRTNKINFIGIFRIKKIKKFFKSFYDDIML